MSNCQWDIIHTYGYVRRRWYSLGWVDGLVRLGLEPGVVPGVALPGYRVGQLVPVIGVALPGYMVGQLVPEIGVALPGYMMGQLEHDFFLVSGPFYTSKSL